MDGRQEPHIKDKGVDMFQIDGVGVMISPFMDTFVEVPEKRHKGNCKTAYSKRIQKKWNKIHGVRYDRSFLSCYGQIVCNQENYDFLKSELA